MGRKRTEHFERRPYDNRIKVAGTYGSWVSMKGRCLWPKTTHYALYGGRGIKVCDRWLKYDNFLADMGERPEGSTLDRIDVDGNYEPTNCRWATPAQQSINRRTVYWIEYKGQRKTIKEWAEILNIAYGTLKARLINRNWSVERAFTQPLKFYGERKSNEL